MNYQFHAVHMHAYGGASDSQTAAQAEIMQYRQVRLLKINSGNKTGDPWQVITDLASWEVIELLVGMDSREFASLCIDHTLCVDTVASWTW